MCICRHEIGIYVILLPTITILVYNKFIFYFICIWQTIWLGLSWRVYIYITNHWIWQRGQPMICLYCCHIPCMTNNKSTILIAVFYLHLYPGFPINILFPYLILAVGIDTCHNESACWLSGLHYSNSSSPSVVKIYIILLRLNLFLTHSKWLLLQV